MAYTNNSNTLFPVFLKLEQLPVLIVGGGYVGLEKLKAILANSPNALVTVVGISISEEIKQLTTDLSNVVLKEKSYDSNDLTGQQIIIAALNDKSVSQQVVQDARSKHILVNAADQPELCDFYLSSIVQKGHLKIAISTNGQSPTMAKRIKEMLNDVLPEELDELLEHMHDIRKNITGDFAEKVKQLNELTKTLAVKKS